MNSITQYILIGIIGAIVGAGGIGGIILAIVKFSSNIIADRLSKKYESRLQQDLERYKTTLNRKEYVSKTRFDAEFSIYKELSVTFCEMVNAIYSLIPCGLSKVPANEEKRREFENNCYVEACKATAKAQNTLNANSPFIPEQFVTDYEELLQLASMQTNSFGMRYDALYIAPQEEKECLRSEDYSRTKELLDKWKNLNQRIRTYLASLDVIE